MRLPNSERAMVAQEKIVGYLLSPANERGRPEARYFASFGFSTEDWEALADALVGLAMQAEVTETIETVHGFQYVLFGDIESPDGRNPRIRSVWQTAYGFDHPRLISAYRASDWTMTVFNQRDLVALTVPIPLDEAGHVPEGSPLRKTGNHEAGLLPGHVGSIDVGSIVDTWGGGEAFIVEFLDPDGCLIALPTVYCAQIRPATEEDLANDRFWQRASA